MPYVLSVAGLACFAACKPPDVLPFVGTWQVSGTGLATRGSADTLQTFSRSSAVPIQTYQIVLAKGQRSDLVSIDSFGCRLQWEVSGSTALIEPLQGCTARGGYSIEINSGTASMTVVDAAHLSVNGKLSGTISQGGAILGVTTAASAQIAGTLTRVER
jgi:hypothetical protein